jgi:tRNA(Ile)-lysidine synthetase-like protein
MDCLSALENAARTGLMPPSSPILLAVSGGADSMALLTAALRLRERLGWRLSVGHVHHGWRAEAADRDLAFVAEHCRRAGLDFSSRRRDARGESLRCGLSPEAGARRVRYAALLEMAREAGASLVATAHHADDRLESFLLARERRGGAASLGGPRARRADGVVRPLLGVPRTEIRAFLAATGVGFRRDASNGNLRLSRNRVRRAIASASPAERAAWETEARRSSDHRDSVDREFAASAAPAIRPGPDSVLADADRISGCSSDVRRRAVETAAAPFARSGRAPMTGREREEILRRLALGTDFHLETGRRIRVERRGGILSFRLRPGAAPDGGVYDFAGLSSHGQHAS